MGLVLTRKVDEQIRVGDVVFTVCKINATKVMVKIDAPADMKITRPETDTPPGLCNDAREAERNA